MTDKLKNVGFILVFVIGAIGGGTSLMRALEHVGLNGTLLYVVGLVYWCAFGMLFSKIEIRQDKQSNYDRGHADGYAAGHEEGLNTGLLAANRALRDKYDKGYDEGYQNGRADGWDQGYAAAKNDQIK